MTDNNISKAENGINTSTWTNVFNDGNGYFRGSGLGRYVNINTAASGGGGYGGNGGYGNVVYTNATWYKFASGGGGGYGSNGGNGNNAAGGGGGYGGDGGDADKGCGGGGGYGKVSKGMSISGGTVSGGGGGGYYCPGFSTGGAGIGIWEDGTMVARFGSGAYFTNNTSGESGICIIQYYV